MREKLSIKQKLFVEAYLGPANGNATEAARRAGYKGNDVTLGAVGAENLKKPLIAIHIKERLEKAIVTTDEILHGVKSIAEKHEARDADKLKAWELLGKHLAIWTEQINHGGLLRVEVAWGNPDDDGDTDEND